MEFEGHRPEQSRTSSTHPTGDLRLRREHLARTHQSTSSYYRLNTNNSPLYRALYAPFTPEKCCDDYLIRRPLPGYDLPALLQKKKKYFESHFSD